jgi:hypothetical protein
VKKLHTDTNRWNQRSSNKSKPGNPSAPLLLAVGKSLFTAPVVDVMHECSPGHSAPGELRQENVLSGTGNKD